MEAGGTGWRHGKRKHRGREYAAASYASTAQRFLTGASRNRRSRRSWERDRQGRHLEWAGWTARSVVGKGRDDRREGVAAFWASGGPIWLCG